MLESRTISISVAVPADAVYAFASKPENLPRWATGLGTSVQRVAGEWFTETPQGRVKFRFAETNPFGILDHYITPAEAEVYVPMRVVPNREGSEILFTLFRQPGVSDAGFQRDIAWVHRDLNRLKEVLEASR